jgi:hypothetical protein
MIDYKSQKLRNCRFLMIPFSWYAIFAMSVMLCRILSKLCGYYQSQLFIAIGFLRQIVQEERGITKEWYDEIKASANKKLEHILLLAPILAL